MRFADSSKHQDGPVFLWSESLPPSIWSVPHLGPTLPSLLLGLELEAEPVRRPRHGRPAGRLVVGGRGAGGAPLLGAAGVHLPVVVELVEDLRTPTNMGFLHF